MKYFEIACSRTIRKGVLEFVSDEKGNQFLPFPDEELSGRRIVDSPIYTCRRD